MRALFASLLFAAHAAQPPPCALNGALQPDGTCACYGPWRGDDCSQLALGAVPAASGYGLAPALRSSWGGNVLADAAGTYHLFVAEMALNCTLATWETNSYIAHATAATPEGPYLRQGAPAVGIWGHNPQVQTLADGSFALFHIGTGVGGTPKNCSWGGGAPAAAPLAPGAAGATVHVAASLEGPWTPFPGVPPCNNPAPLLHPNGTLFLACNSATILRAPALAGPWSTLSTPTFNNHSNAPIGGYEDAFLWIDPRGAWHALFHVWSEEVEPSCVNSNVSAHGFSTNGLDWHFSPLQPYGTTVTLEDGTSFISPTRERPKLLMGPDGEPTHLLNGAVRDIESCAPHWCSRCKMLSQHTFTLVTPLLAGGAGKGAPLASAVDSRAHSLEGKDGGAVKI